MSSKAGIADAAAGAGVSFADYDHDGFMDVYVATTPFNRFYTDNRNGTFAEAGLLAGVGFNEDGKTFAGMGVDFADYDNDGHPDSWSPISRTNATGCFARTTTAAFATDRMSGLGGASAFLGLEHRLFDYDNDGWKDRFVAQDT